MSFIRSTEMDSATERFLIAMGDPFCEIERDDGSVPMSPVQADTPVESPFASLIAASTVFALPILMFVIWSVFHAR